MVTDQVQLHAPVRLDVRAATVDDIRQSLRAGLRDMARRPGLSLLFGVFYALFGAALLAGLLLADQFWLVIAAAVGFPLVAPFLAAGLYEMSRRLERDEPFGARDIFGAVFGQQQREFGWISFILLFVFWVWAYQVRLVLALTLKYQGFRSLDHFLETLFTTGDGLAFLVIGTVVGAFLATVIYAITVITMPLLLDKQVDCVTAMITSVKTVRASPAVMLGWGVAVGALTLLAIVPLFLGVVVIFPLLGHASWHLYGRLVREA